MIFTFIKYTTPISYFNKLRKNGTSIFPKWEQLPENIKSQIELDTNFKSLESSFLDGSWQAIQKGYIGEVETYLFNNDIPIEDEYRFIRKYYSGLWSYYTLIVRILTLNNPFREVGSFLKTMNVSRVNVYNKPLEVLGWNNFNSLLIQSNPKVSVVIPTLNRYEYLKDVLEDLEKQDYKNFDVIIVDQTEPFQESFYAKFNLDLDVIFQEEKALWLARNFAINKSNANYILLFDDDSRVNPDWISNHIKCLDFFKTSISSGTSISVVGAKVPQSYSYFKLSDQIDTGNVMINKQEVFGCINLFDRQFEKQRMGDGEFGMRAYLNGFVNISNPYSSRLHLKVSTGGLRQMGSWDGMRPKNWLSPRPIPSVLYLYRKHWGNKSAIFALFQSIPLSLTPYHKKGTTIGYLQSIAIFLVFFPFVLLQVMISWRRASTKLKQGNLIQKYKN